MKALVNGERKQEGEIEEKLKHHCEQQSRCTESSRASSPMKSLPHPYNGWDTKTSFDGVEDIRCRIEHTYLRLRQICVGITESEAGGERKEGKSNRQMIEQEQKKGQEAQGHPTNERAHASQRPRRAICPFCSAFHIQSGGSVFPLSIRCGHACFTSVPSCCKRSTPKLEVTCFGEEKSQDQQEMSQNSKDGTGIGIAHSFRQTQTSLLVYTARACFPSRVDSRKMRPRFHCKLDERNRLQIGCAVCSFLVTSCKSIGNFDRIKVPNFSRVLETFRLAVSEGIAAYYIGKNILSSYLLY
jgi:hypothetical protein